MMETDSLQVCVLCLQFLLLTLHFPAPVALEFSELMAGSLQFPDVCEPSPAFPSWWAWEGPDTNLGWLELLQPCLWWKHHTWVPFIHPLANSTEICWGSGLEPNPSHIVGLGLVGPNILRELIVRNKPTWNLVYLHIVELDLVGPNILGEQMDQKKPIWYWVYFKGKLSLSP